MKQEDKELLLQDLCGRIPYGVKMNHIADDEHSPNTLIGIAKDMITLEGPGGYECVDVEHYKPYLFPLSSMTEEQKEELNKCVKQDYQKEYDNFVNNISNGVMKSIPMPNENVIEFYHKNYIDYRGLISKGLAIDCTGLNIY